MQCASSTATATILDDTAGSSIASLHLTLARASGEQKSSLSFLRLMSAARRFSTVFENVKKRILHSDVSYRSKRGSKPEICFSFINWINTTQVSTTNTIDVVPKAHHSIYFSRTEQRFVCVCVRVWSEFCSSHNIQWKYILERSHFGGFWESAVKSAKTMLKRVVSPVKLTFEEFTTVLTQIEACLTVALSLLLIYLRTMV